MGKWLRKAPSPKSGELTESCGVGLDKVEDRLSIFRRGRFSPHISFEDLWDRFNLSIKGLTPTSSKMRRSLVRVILRKFLGCRGKRVCSVLQK